MAIIYGKLSLPKTYGSYKRLKLQKLQVTKIKWSVLEMYGGVLESYG